MSINIGEILLTLWNDSGFAAIFSGFSAGGWQNLAMLMAIVADKLGKPLNELRFISIKEDK